jgi:hypothetical protein
MNKEDRAIIIRTSVSEGVANSRQSAIARAVLDIDARLEKTVAGGGESNGEVSPELEERLGRIEAALGKVELPDLPELEGTIEGFDQRLSALEQGLGATPPATAKKKAPTKRS